MSGSAVAPEINADQQLMGLYENVWAAEAEAKALSPLNPAAGLDLYAADRDLTPTTLEELGTDELAAIGKQGLAGWLDAQARAAEIEQANSRTVAAGDRVVAFVKSLEGMSVTVEALDPENDIPIALMRRVLESSGGHQEWPVKHPVSATCLLDFWSARMHPQGMGNFNPNMLALLRQPSRIPRSYAYLAVALHDVRTNEPRVSLTIEDS